MCGSAKTLGSKELNSETSTSVFVILKIIEM